MNLCPTEVVMGLCTQPLATGVFFSEKEKGGQVSKGTKSFENHAG